MTHHLGKRLGESSRICASCNRELPCTVKYFPLVADAPAGLGRTCKKCRKRNSDGEHEGKPRKGRHCFECSGLAHRRPEDRACSCGKMFADEPPMTIHEVMAQPRNYDRIVVL